MGAKIIAINGSPRAKGNTHYALNIIKEELAPLGVEVEIVHIGHKAIHGCIACGKCKESGDGRCAIKGDEVNEMIGRMTEADGIIIGSPVYYSGIAGGMKCFLDRVFYASSSLKPFKGKIGASVVALRRGGGTTTFSALNYYLHIAQMRMVGSQYWNMIHGRLPGEAALDEEGVATMRTLAQNIAQELLEIKN